MSADGSGWTLKASVASGLMWSEWRQRDAWRAVWEARQAAEESRRARESAVAAARQALEASQTEALGAMQRSVSERIRARELDYAWASSWADVLARAQRDHGAFYDINTMHGTMRNLAEPRGRLPPDIMDELDRRVRAARAVYQQAVAEIPQSDEPATVDVLPILYKEKLGTRAFGLNSN